jgi:hypothetical protein
MADDALTTGIDRREKKRRFGASFFVSRDALYLGFH